MMLSQDNFDHRVAMCEGVHEGSEIEDIIKNLARTARMLHAFEDHFCEIVLVIAEKLCTDYIKDVLRARQCDWDEYVETCTDEVFAHFTGGARKLSQKEFEHE
jgi:hypothetical protein